MVQAPPFRKRKGFLGKQPKSAPELALTPMSSILACSVGGSSPDSLELTPLSATRTNEVFIFDIALEDEDTLGRIEPGFLSSNADDSVAYFNNLCGSDERNEVGSHTEDGMFTMAVTH